MPNIERMTGPKKEKRVAHGRYSRRHRKAPHIAVNPVDPASIVCVAKSARGNRFDRLAEAKIVARRMTVQAGKLIEAYKCGACGDYHVGKPMRRKGVRP
jgi:hypothetical protein